MSGGADHEQIDPQFARKLDNGAHRMTGEDMRLQGESLLLGHGTPAERNAVALNAGALLATAGTAEDLKQGVDLAIATIASGQALATLQTLIEVTND